MELRVKALSVSLACSILLAACSSDNETPTSASDAISGSTITSQVSAMVLDADQLALDESGNYIRENVELNLEAVSGDFSGYADKRLKVSAGTAIRISLSSADTITEMRMELLTTEPVLSVDTLVSGTDKLSSISQPTVTSAGSRTLYFDDFADTDTSTSLTFNQDVEIQEVQIKTSKHLVTQEFTVDEVSEYAVLADDGTGTSISKNAYANLLTDGQSIAVDGRYPREKVKVTVEAMSGNLGGYTARNIRINAGTTVKFSINRDAVFYALEFDVVAVSGATTAEELVSVSDDMNWSLFEKPDEDIQRLSVRSAEAEGAVTSEVTFLNDTVLLSVDFYSNDLTVRF